jgi:hypothetical protein
MTIVAMILLPPVLKEISEFNNGAVNLVILVGILWGFSVAIALLGVIIYKEE